MKDITIIVLFFLPQVNKQIGTYILDGEVLSGIFCRPINYNEIISCINFRQMQLKTMGKC